MSVHPLIDAALEPPPRICQHLPGTGGQLKSEPEDFEVEEVPAYAPVGHGEHLFIWVQKRDLAAMAMTDHVAQALGIDVRDIGCAGLKDARAVTRQYLSVPAACQARLEALDAVPGLRVLDSGLHTNKLKTGHLRGNRFTLVVREVGHDGLARAQAILAHLETRGLPNFFGAQRMGRGGATVGQGLSVVGAHPLPARRLGRNQLRLALSALQAAVFNAVLRQRMADGLIHKVLPGDVMQVCASGGPFVVEDVAAEQARFDAWEVVPTGPMVGPKMRQPTGDALAREALALAAFALNADHFAHHGKLMQGTRRPNLIRPADMVVAAAQDGCLRLNFTLPPGSYATGILHEVMG